MLRILQVVCLALVQKIFGMKINTVKKNSRPIDPDQEIYTYDFQRKYDFDNFVKLASLLGWTQTHTIAYLYETILGQDTSTMLWFLDSNFVMNTTLAAMLQARMKGRQWIILQWRKLVFARRCFKI